MDAKNTPKIEIASGERIEVETIRADNMYLNRENPVFRDHAHVMSVLANPVTGPIYIAGARPGDCLQVTIEDIVLGDCGNEGYYTYVPGQGVFANPFYPECFRLRQNGVMCVGKSCSLKWMEEFFTRLRSHL